MRCAIILSVCFVSLAAAACERTTIPQRDADKANLAPLTTDRVLFLHRSVGGNIVRNGDPDMYEVLAELNAHYKASVELWHHFCGTDPWWNRYYDGADTQVTPNFGPAMHEPLYAQPLHWKKIFCDPDPQYAAARDSIDNFDIILFKSGYDNTIAGAASKTAGWRDNYNDMKSSPIFSDPTRRIIVLGMPPVREGFGSATQADADSARAFAEWLGESFILGRGNFYMFPLFDVMADTDNWLRDEFEMANINDSHPNDDGSTIIGRELMTYIHAVARLGDQAPRVFIQNR